MKCPKCEITELSMSERTGVEIDYCPTCRGVWLDRGELDKIIERVSLADKLARHSTDRGTPYSREERGLRRYEDDDDHRKYSKKRGGFLGDLFDF
ncbi:MAG: zf-TFIIB domain-containing protein [Chthonomonas sp.]|nr:zf-TFIIB domain-containing protein [Chthonomonas sp.]